MTADSSTPVWIRERQTPRPAPRPRVVRSGRKPLTLLRPAHRAFLASQQAAEQGVAMTTLAGLRGRRVDDPIPDETLVMDRDERNEKPLALISRGTKPGEATVIVVGAGQYHWQELHERVQEKRHYGEDRAPDRDRPDLYAEWGEEAERRHSRKKGQFHSAPGQTHGVLDSSGKADWWSS